VILEKFKQGSGTHFLFSTEGGGSGWNTKTIQLDKRHSHPIKCKERVELGH
jgi:hypothetical protein